MWLLSVYPFRLISSLPVHVIIGYASRCLFRAWLNFCCSFFSQSFHLIPSKNFLRFVIFPTAGDQMTTGRSVDDSVSPVSVSGISFSRSTSAARDRKRRPHIVTREWKEKKRLENRVHSQSSTREDHPFCRKLKVVIRLHPLFSLFRMFSFPYVFHFPSSSSSLFSYSAFCCLHAFLLLLVMKRSLMEKRQTVLQLRVKSYLDQCFAATAFRKTISRCCCSCVDRRLFLPVNHYLLLLPSDHSLCSQSLDSEIHEVHLLHSSLRKIFWNPIQSEHWRNR